MLKGNWKQSFLKKCVNDKIVNIMCCYVAEELRREEKTRPDKLLCPNVSLEKKNNTDSRTFGEFKNRRMQGISEQSFSRKGWKVRGSFHAFKIVFCVSIPGKGILFDICFNWKRLVALIAFCYPLILTWQELYGIGTVLYKLNVLVYPNNV